MNFITNTPFIEFNIDTNWISKAISFLKQWKLAQLCDWKNVKFHEQHGAGSSLKKL
jgi:hypothetical protein